MHTKERKSSHHFTIWLIPLLVSAMLVFVVPTFAQTDTGAIHGTVLTADTNQPVPGGVYVYAYLRENTSVGYGACTNIDGTYTINDVPLDADLVVWVIGMVDCNGNTLNYVNKYHNNQLALLDTPTYRLTYDSPALTNVDFRLSTGGAVSGRVLDSLTGQPILGGVRVYATLQNALWSTYWTCTAEDGSYTLSGIPTSRLFSVQFYPAPTTCDGRPFDYQIYQQENRLSIARGLLIPAADMTVNADLVIQETPATNQPPLVTNPGNRTRYEGAVINLQIQATDPDGDLLNYSMVTKLGGLTIDLATGLISGRVPLSTARSAPYGMTVTVRDGGSPAMSASVRFDWTILPDSNTAPSLLNPGDQFSYVGEPITLAMTATDFDGDSLEFNAINLPAGLTMNSMEGVITGGIDGSALMDAPYEVTVMVTDNGTPPKSAYATFHWNIADTSDDGVYNMAVYGLDESPVLPVLQWTYISRTSSLNMGVMSGRWYAIYMERYLPDGTTEVLLNGETWYPAEQLCTGSRCTFAPNVELFYEGTYSWVVSVWDDNMMSSGQAEFTVDLAIPGHPENVQVSAANGLLSLSWEDEPEAGWQWFYIARADDVFNVAYNSLWFPKSDAICDGTTCRMSVNGLFESGVEYIVYIATWGPGGIPADSYDTGFDHDTYNVHVGSYNKPAAPVGLTVTEVQSGKPTFAWQNQPGTTWYEVIISSLNPDGLVVEHYNNWVSVLDISCDVVCSLNNDDIFLGNGNYTMTLTAFGPGGMGDAAAVMNFAVTSSVPSQPTLISPINSTLNTVLPVFKWNHDVNVSWYNFGYEETTSDGTKVWTDGLWFTADELGCDDGICQLTFTDRYFWSPTYTWSIQGFNAAGGSEWAIGASFHIQQ